MFLVRKISRAKWDSKNNIALRLSEGEIAADAVTGDLRTRGNAVSFWQCSDFVNADIEDTALAIAAAGDRIDKLDIVWLSQSDLTSDGHIIENTDGRTPFRDFVHRHVDVCRLDYDRLGKLAVRVHLAIQNNQCRRLTKLRIRTLLGLAVGNGRISLQDLHEEIRNQIQYDAQSR